MEISPVKKSMRVRRYRQADEFGEEGLAVFVVLDGWAEGLGSGVVFCVEGVSPRRKVRVRKEWRFAQL